MAAPIAASDHRHAVIAGFLGWTLDAFDFFLVVFALTDIGKEFCTRRARRWRSPSRMTLFMRPVGAFIFGLIADRYGRRLPLMLDLVFFSIVEVAVGSRARATRRSSCCACCSASAWAGSGASGRRWPWRRRRAIGAACCPGSCSRATRRAICWRPSATCSCFRTGAGGRCSSSAGCRRCWRIYVRIGVKESEVWEKTRRAGLVASRPGDRWRTGRLFLYIFVLMTVMNFVSHGTQDMYPTFLKTYRGFTPQRGVVHRRCSTTSARSSAASSSGATRTRSGAGARWLPPCCSPSCVDSALGLRAADGAPARWRVPAAVHGAGGVGRRAGAHQ